MFELLVVLLGGGGLTLVGSLVATRASSKQHRETLASQVEQKRLDLEASRTAQHVEAKRALYAEVLGAVSERVVQADLEASHAESEDDESWFADFRSQAAKYWQASAELKRHEGQVRLYSEEVGDLVLDITAIVDKTAHAYWDSSAAYPGTEGDMTKESIRYYAEALKAKHARLAGLMRHSLNS